MSDQIIGLDDDNDPLLSPGYYQESAAMRAMRDMPIPTATVSEFQESARLYHTVYVYGRGYAVTNWYGKLLHFTMDQSKASRWGKQSSAQKWAKRHGYIL